MIKVENISKKFIKEIQNKEKIEFYADKDITFEAKDGEILGILGPNGAGKTTLLRMISGIMTPSSGTITIDNLNYKDNELEIKKRISFLTGNTKLYKDLSAYELLTMCGEYYGLSTKEINNRIKDLDKTLKIKVIGVGGAGNNAISRMIDDNVRGVTFYMINTETGTLKRSRTSNILQIGVQTTRGLGAGANELVGERAAIENKEDIKQMLAGADLVFITAGMGGGTGTGAAPIVAEIAKEMGILTVGIVTKPFLFEGKARSLRASKGIERLKSNVDDLIVVLNDNLLKITDSKITLDNAFSLADNILEQGITSITDLLTSVGEVNIDFADIKTTMNYRGKAYMGIGRASGEKKVEEAVRQAIENPLTESKIDGAKGVIFNVKGNSDLGLMEINSAVGLINEKVSEDANIIFGTVIDEDMGEDVQVTVIATGVEEKVETEVKQ